ncbi:MAG: MoxR family ATPase [Burkholderiales bacterium]|jgi:MoxR-like ATPase|nr:MoxR family ATPase [Burkholderiales bacterium]
MPFPYIDGKRGAEPPKEPVALPTAQRAAQAAPAGYLADERLVDAINVALLLSQPLLLTGEPGTGKTQLAHWLAWKLGYGKPLVFNTKSGSTARDLFYTFDTMRRFHVAQTNDKLGSTDNVDYLSYNALGLAILNSRMRKDVEAVLPRGFEHNGPRRAVVLIDEIDKAPRDFPNDLLHEIDAMAFRVAEVRNIEVTAGDDKRPVLVLTSNSERNLPDAFLRRCVFYNIPFPTTTRLVDIVHARLPTFKDGARALLDDALKFFIEQRDAGMRKPPSTAELLNWLQAMVSHGANPAAPLKDSADAVRRSLSTLAKTQDDAAELAARLDAHITARQPG